MYLKKSKKIRKVLKILTRHSTSMISNDTHNYNQNTRFRSTTDSFSCNVMEEIKIFFNNFIFINSYTHRLLNLAGPQGRKKSTGLKGGAGQITLFLAIGLNHKYLD